MSLFAQDLRRQSWFEDGGWRTGQEVSFSLHLKAKSDHLVVSENKRQCTSLFVCVLFVSICFSLMLLLKNST